MAKAFQIILLISISFTLLGVLGEKQDKELRRHLVAICLSSIAAFVITLVVFGGE